MENTDTMSMRDEILRVNKFARRSRHMRIFSRVDIVRMHLKDFATWVFKPVGLLTNTSPFKKTVSFFERIKNLLVNALPVSPQRRLFFYSAVASVSILVVSSVVPTAAVTANHITYSSEYIESYSLPGDILVSDESGYLVKINPQTSTSSREGMTDFAVHTVESGESLSVIAERYGVAVSTIMWENSMSNANSLRIGQKLLVPPVDGVSYKVAAGDSIEKIASKFDISKETIIAQNALDSEVIAKGQRLFLPGAEPIAPPVTIAAGAGTRAVSAATRSTRDYSDSSATPVAGKIFIFPTRGKITQGYGRGHYALDIADRSRPPVWAAAGGTVVKASSGTWGGGYGNHVIIDHGNGMQTLYGHLDTVGVEVGQEVSQGEVIGVMGNTGRVYGVTGIHLHWECIESGVKKYCGNYY